MTDSKQIDDGGPAFSVCFEGGQNNGDSPYFHEGMSQRKWFAGMALSGLVEMHHGVGVDPISVARAAYQYADAMIAAGKAGAA